MKNLDFKVDLVNDYLDTWMNKANDYYCYIKNKKNYYKYDDYEETMNLTRFNDFFKELLGRIRDYD